MATTESARHGSAESVSRTKGPMQIGVSAWFMVNRVWSRDITSSSRRFGRGHFCMETLALRSTRLIRASTEVSMQARNALSTLSLWAL